MICCHCNSFFLFFFFKKIPQIDVVFAELNKTVKDTTVLSGDAKTTVNDSLNAGVHEINYTQYEEQVRVLRMYAIVPPLLWTSVFEIHVHS